VGPLGPRIVVPIEAAKPRSVRASVKYLADITEPLGDEWSIDE
jgi:hypothetical protein